MSKRQELGEQYTALRERANVLKCKLEKIDAELFAQLRAELRAGAYRGPFFKKMISCYVRNAFGEGAPADEPGYDLLDGFVNSLLSDQPLPEATRERKAGMVFYQKTPARIVFEMMALAEVNPEDYFVDLGSGLGQVGLLVHLISGVHVRGIEYDPGYYHYAKRSAAELSLSDVEFMNGDVRQVDYSRGTLFYLYTPFEGTMLEEMLEILRIHAKGKNIRIFTYGPCSACFARLDWLQRIKGNPDNPYSLCLFRNVDSN